MRITRVRLVAVYVIAVLIVLALGTLQQPEIGVAHAAAKESKKEPRIYGNAAAFVTQYKKLQELGEIKKVVTPSSKGTKQLQISYKGQSSKMSGTVNTDGSLRTMTYQANDFPYFTQKTLDQMKKNGVQGHAGVTVFKTLLVFVDIFSPTANPAEKEKVYALFNPTPRLSPGKAIWRTASAGSIMYSLYVTKEGVCTIKVWRTEIYVENESKRYVFHYGEKENANKYPEHYDTAALIGTMNGKKDQEKVALIRFDNGKFNIKPLYAVFSIQSGTLSTLYDASLAIETKGSAMSDDKSKFVFEGSVGTSLTLYVTDLKNQKLARYDLPKDGLTSSITKVEWIDGDTIGVEGHLNPWIRSYYILDISSGTWREPLYGLFFSWTQRGLFYVESFPNSKGGKSIKSADGTVLYSTGPEESSIVNGLSFSSTDDRVVFFEQNDVTDKITLVVASLDGANPLRIDKRIPYEGVTGAIEWTGENQIEISQGESLSRVTIKL